MQRAPTTWRRAARQAMVHEHVHDQRWGAHAARIEDGTLWRHPRSGGHDDKAHPPIHPTKWSAGEGGWDRDKQKVYEFVVRHFLACALSSLSFRPLQNAMAGMLTVLLHVSAVDIRMQYNKHPSTINVRRCCSRDAVGYETRIMIDIGGEEFTASGAAAKRFSCADVGTHARTRMGAWPRAHTHARVHTHMHKRATHACTRRHARRPDGHRAQLAGGVPVGQVGRQ